MVNFTETEKYIYPRVVFKPIKDVADNPDKLSSNISYADMKDCLLFK